MSCGKTIHFTDTSAENHADRLEAASGVRPNVYQCDRCGFWHVGYSEKLAQRMNKRSQRKRSKYHRRKQKARYV